MLKVGTRVWNETPVPGLLHHNGWDVFMQTFLLTSLSLSQAVPTNFYLTPLVGDPKI